MAKSPPSENPFQVFLQLRRAERKYHRGMGVPKAEMNMRCTAPPEAAQMIDEEAGATGAIDLQGRGAEPNRTLAISYHHIKEYAFAVMAARRVQELRNSTATTATLRCAQGRSQWQCCRCR